MTEEHALPPTTAREAMITLPALHPADITVEAAHEALQDPHVHLLLLVEARRLVGTLDRADLEQADHEDQPARELAVLEGRTTSPDVDVAPVGAEMTATGTRRLAVVDADGVLLGLLCLKRSGAGFCSDAGVAARSAARRRTA